MKKLLLLFTLLLVNVTMNAQWTDQSTGFEEVSRGLLDIYPVDANVVWAIGYDGSGGGAEVQEFTRTTNGGGAWTAGLIDVGNTLLTITNIVAVNETTAWVGAFDQTDGLGGVFKTSDGGVTWEGQNTDAYITPTLSWFNAVHFWNANEGITLGDPTATEFEIFRTTDGGLTWTAPAPTSLPNPSSGEYGYNGGVVAAGNTLWFTTNKGKLYRTSDRGLTWTKLNGPAGITDFGSAAVNARVYFSNDTNGVILGTTDSGATYKFFTTTNGGTTWSAGVTYTGGFNRILAYIPGTTTIVATGISATAPAVPGSAFSNDNGVTWTPIDTGTQRGAVAFVNSTTGWCSGFTTNSTVGGVSKYTGPDLSVDSVNAKLKISATPNPTTGFLKLSTTIDTINQVTVFDLLGKQVYNSKFTSLNEVNVDLSSLQVGAYLVKATSDTGLTETIKIMKN